MKTVTTFLILAMAAVPRGAQDSQELIQALQQPGTAAQREARQLLPRHGVSAIAGLLPLLGNEDAQIAWAARAVLRDIMNEAAQHGNETEAAAAADLLLEHLQSGVPDAVRIETLRLAAIVLPEGHNHEPIAALLQDPELREEARRALYLANTAQTRAAICDALPGADAAFARALLDCIQKWEAPDCLDAAEAMAGHADPGVQAAALRALSWSGDSRYVPLFEAVPPNAAFESADAALRFAEAMLENGGQWQRGISLIESFLADGANPVIAQTAMMALATYGDSSAVDTLIETTDLNDPDMQRALAMALATVKGHGAAVRIAEAYPALPRALQVAVLKTRGPKLEAPILALVESALTHEDPALRAVAEQTLIDAAHPSAIPIVVNRADAATGTARSDALSDLADLAEEMARSGHPGAAGMGYARILELAETDAQRRTALEGLGRYPVIPAADAVKAAAQSDELRMATVPALIGVAEALADANQRDPARALLQLATQIDSSPPTMQRVAPLLGRVQAYEDMGFLTEWHLAGPFAWNDDADWERAFVGEPGVDITQPVEYNGGTLPWKAVATNDPMGMVNLMSEIGAVDRSFAYAYTEFDAAQAGPAQLRMGSDDGLTVWLNGEVVHDNPVDRGFSLDQDVVNVTLKPGTNRLLLRISQGAGGWAFGCRLTAADGAPLSLGES